MNWTSPNTAATVLMVSTSCMAFCLWTKWLDIGMVGLGLAVGYIVVYVMDWRDKSTR